MIRPVMTSASGGVWTVCETANRVYKYWAWYRKEWLRLVPLGVRGSGLLGHCWHLVSQGGEGRRESDSQVFCHPNSMHARVIVSPETSSLHHVRTTTTPHHTHHTHHTTTPPHPACALLLTPRAFFFLTLVAFSGTPGALGRIPRPSDRLPADPPFSDPPPRDRPKFRFFSLSCRKFHCSSLSGGLLVEVWSRFTAVDRFKCAFGLLGVIL